MQNTALAHAASAAPPATTSTAPLREFELARHSGRLYTARTFDHELRAQAAMLRGMRRDSMSLRSASL